MNRLAKKCFIGSMMLHASLVGVLLICSAFVGNKEEPKDQVIELMPFGGKFTVTDGPSQFHGAPPPVAKPTPQPPTAAPSPAAQPAPQHVEKAEPTPPKPEHHVEKTVPVKPTPKDDGEEPVKWKPRQVKVDLTKVVTSNSRKTSRTKKQQQTDSEADGAAEAANAKRIAKLAQNISGIADSLARSTAQQVVSDSYGDGTPGVAAVNYRTLLFTIYYNAWISPDEVNDADATTDARVVVARDGTIVSWTLERRSGNAAMDRSVERALRAVRKLEAFPPGWRESEKTFRIRFNLKSKLAIG